MFVRKWRLSSARFEHYSRPWFLITLGVALLAAIMTTVSFIIDLVFVAVVDNKITDEADGAVHLSRGNAVRPTYLRFVDGRRPLTLGGIPRCG